MSYSSNFSGERGNVRVLLRELNLKMNCKRLLKVTMPTLLTCNWRLYTRKLHERWWLLTCPSFGENEGRHVVYSRKQDYYYHTMNSTNRCLCALPHMHFCRLEREREREREKRTWVVEMTRSLSLSLCVCVSVCVCVCVCTVRTTRACKQRQRRTDGKARSHLMTHPLY